MNIYKFYNTYGWKEKNNISKDAELFEDLRKNSENYVSNCRKRILKYIPNKGQHILDFASGPLQYKEYLEYSKNYKFRHCVDFSKGAIESAKKKLKKKGKYYCGNFFNIKFKANFFDCILSMHTIYHIKKTKQKNAILKLLKIAKKGVPIIIVYSNPDTIISKIKKIFKYKSKQKEKLYFFCHSNDWWLQFEKFSKIKFYPWRSFSSGHQKIIFPNNLLGKIMFSILFFLEETFKDFFVNNFQYKIIVLKKK